MGRHAQFNLPALAEAGLRITKRDGWSAVSVASVAAELSVTPMALYRVVDDAERLRQVIADSAAPAVPVSSEMTLIDSLRAWALEAHQQLNELPGLATYVTHEWTELPHWLEIVEKFLQLAAQEGLRGADAVATVNAVFAFALARSQLSDSVSAQRRLQPILEQPARYPFVRRNRKEFSTARSKAAFMFGLDALIRGLTTRPVRRVAPLR
jgi:AcrR family transcriptional regulator